MIKYSVAGCGSIWEEKALVLHQNLLAIRSQSLQSHNQARLGAPSYDLVHTLEKVKKHITQKDILGLDRGIDERDERDGQRRVAWKPPRKQMV
jgi:hypothetical protein